MEQMNYIDRFLFDSAASCVYDKCQVDGPCVVYHVVYAYTILRNLTTWYTTWYTTFEKVYPEPYVRHVKAVKMTYEIHIARIYNT